MIPYWSQSLSVRKEVGPGAFIRMFTIFFSAFTSKHCRLKQSFLSVSMYTDRMSVWTNDVDCWYASIWFQNYKFKFIVASLFLLTMNSFAYSTMHHYWARVRVDSPFKVHLINKHCVIYIFWRIQNSSFAFWFISGSTKNIALFVWCQFRLINC